MGTGTGVTTAGASPHFPEGVAQGVNIDHAVAFVAFGNIRGCKVGVEVADCGNRVEDRIEAEQAKFVDP